MMATNEEEWTPTKAEIAIEVGHRALANASGRRGEVVEIPTQALAMLILTAEQQRSTQSRLDIEHARARRAEVANEREGA